METQARSIFLPTSVLVWSGFGCGGLTTSDTSSGIIIVCLTSVGCKSSSTQPARSHRIDMPARLVPCRLRASPQSLLTVSTRRYQSSPGKSGTKDIAKETKDDVEGQMEYASAKDGPPKQDTRPQQDGPPPSKSHVPGMSKEDLSKRK